MLRRCSGRSIAIFGLALLVAGCSKGSWKSPFAPAPLVHTPSAATPTEALRLLEWSWNGKDSALYATVLPKDFRFVFSAQDPAGIPYADAPWTRNDELVMIGHLFQSGSTSLPPATSIRLVLDRELTAHDDPRPGKLSRWHRLVRSSFQLMLVDAGGGGWDISGFSDFYLVRGDSAAIATDKLELGPEPDSTRWYLERWEEESAWSEGILARTGTARPSRTLPARDATLGALRALYR